MIGLLTLSLGTLLSGARCENEVLRELDRFRGRADAIVPIAPHTTGARAALLPTDSLGVWIRVTVDASGEPLVEWVTEALVERRRFGETCRPVDGGREGLPIDANAWSDTSLAETLATGGAGVILLWSPHMPLSVDAFGLLEALTGEMGISLVAILHPGADPSYARSVALERGMRPSALRPLGGIELAFRGMTTHAPSILVFARGRFAGPVLPGYRDRAGFKVAIERALREH